MKAPKYPRIMVNAERHIKLAAEAKKRGMSLTQLAEEKFEKSDDMITK